jgi:hypothetical protein
VLEVTARNFFLLEKNKGVEEGAFQDFESTLELGIGGEEI